MLLVATCFRLPLYNKIIPSLNSIIFGTNISKQSICQQVIYIKNGVMQTILLWTKCQNVRGEKLVCFSITGGLQCLVAFELKADKFKSEQLGQLNFYLEVLDRDVKKPSENHSIRHSIYVKPKTAKVAFIRISFFSFL